MNLQLISKNHLLKSFEVKFVSVDTSGIKNIQKR